MKNTTCSLLVILLLGAGFVGCENASRSRTTRDAALGATAGAVIGGVIGHNSGDEAAEGAAIGAAVGAVAGAAHGRSKERDRDVRRDDDEYYRSLLTAEEVDILRERARTSDRQNYELTDFLTSQEKSNLRRRDEALRREEIRDREIGR